MTHLKGSGTAKSVIRSYNDKYDSTADSRIGQYTRQIEQYSAEIERIDERLKDIEIEGERAGDKSSALTERINENRDGEEYQRKKDKLLRQREAIVKRRNTLISEMLKAFNGVAPAYFARRLMRDSLEQLAQGHKLDKGVPDIHARTIDHIITYGRCICGAEVSSIHEPRNCR